MIALGVVLRRAGRSRDGHALSHRPHTGDRLHFVGTATTVVSMGSFTFLTDPNFLHRGQRAYLGWGLSSRRLTDPAIEPEDLPSLDAIVLSHLHGDHFDRVARARLDRSPPVLSTPHAVRRLGRGASTPARCRRGSTTPSSRAARSCGTRPSPRSMPAACSAGCSRP